MSVVNIESLLFVRHRRQKEDTLYTYFWSARSRAHQRVYERCEGFGAGTGPNENGSRYSRHPRARMLPGRVEDSKWPETECSQFDSSQ